MFFMGFYAGQRFTIKQSKKVQLNITSEYVYYIEDNAERVAHTSRSCEHLRRAQEHRLKARRVCVACAARDAKQR